MSEKQERIMNMLSELLPKMNDTEREKLLSFGEGMAFMMRDRVDQQAAAKPGA